MVSQPVSVLPQTQVKREHGLPCCSTQVQTRCHLISPGAGKRALCLLCLFGQIQMQKNVKTFLVSGVDGNFCWTDGLYNCQEKEKKRGLEVIEDITQKRK